MGLTHYWEVKQDLTPSQWMKIQLKTRELIKKARSRGICIAGGHGKGKPHVGPDVISLNGCKANAHETLYFTPGKTDFDFCKTAGKPYDALVVSFLNEARKIAPGKIKVTSDGGPEAIKTVLRGRKR